MLGFFQWSHSIYSRMAVNTVRSNVGITYILGALGLGHGRRPSFAGVVEQHGRSETQAAETDFGPSSFGAAGPTFSTK